MQITQRDPAFVWSYHEIFPSAGIELARRLRKPLVQFVDAPQIWEGRGWGVKRPGWGWLLERLAERPQLRQADVVACVSEEVARAVAQLGVPERRLLITPNGVDLERFSPRTSGREVRARLGLEERFVLGWAGSFRPFHGLSMAVEAAGCLRSSIPDLALLLIGDGHQRRSVEARAGSAGVPLVITGTVPYDEMPAHVAAIDVPLVLDEGHWSYHYSPLKLREYMASGKPTVAARSGEVGRVVTDGIDGLLVDAGNVSAVADAVRRIHDEPGLRQALGRAARRTAVAKWSWDTQLDRLCAALEARRAGREVT
jgi:glycosyltransferase involved in cell wall biosynthesis